MGQERLGPSYFFISLVLGPLNSLVWYAPSSSRPVIGAESRPALKVSFNRPRPRSQPARAAGRVCFGLCAGCLFFFSRQLGQL
jgi:hypothetical protein